MTAKEAALELYNKIHRHPLFISIGANTDTIFVNVTHVVPDLKFEDGWMGYPVITQKAGIPQALPHYSSKLKP